LAENKQHGTTITSGTYQWTEMMAAGSTITTDRGHICSGKRTRTTWVAEYG